jgi:hypothetical protein
MRASIPGRARRERHRQCPAHRPDCPFEAELTQDRDLGEPVRRHLLRCSQNPQRDRQIEGGALFSNVGGREIDRDPLEREGEAGIRKGGGDPVAPFLYCALRQPDRHERGQAVRDVGLDLHQVRVDPKDGGGADAREHGRR